MSTAVIEGSWFARSQGSRTRPTNTQTCSDAHTSAVPSRHLSRLHLIRGGFTPPTDLNCTYTMREFCSASEASRAANATPPRVQPAPLSRQDLSRPRSRKKSSRCAYPSSCSQGSCADGPNAATSRCEVTTSARAKALQQLKAHIYLITGSVSTIKSTWLKFFSGNKILVLRNGRVFLPQCLTLILSSSL